MSALVGPALVVAALLALAGARKLLDPTMTVGALRALGLPSSSALVRAGSAAEAALGVAAISVGGTGLWWLVALSYAAFAAFVVAALRKGTMIGSCGCFGREDTPPHVSHVVLDLLLAGTAAGAALTLDRALIDELRDRPGQGALIALLAGIALYLLYVAYLQLPRTLAQARGLPTD